MAEETEPMGNGGTLEQHVPASASSKGGGSGWLLPTASRCPGGVPALDLTGLGAQRQIEPRVLRLEAEMDAARRQGVWGLLRLRYEAWLEERMMGPAVRKMQARQAVLEEQRKTADAEIRLKATVQSGEVGAQRHRIEWNEVNRQRLASELQSLGLVTLSPGPPPSAPPVAPHVTDEQVEAVALRGFLEGVETEEDWLNYRGELGRHLSPYAVEEVGQRLRDLWRLNRQAQGPHAGQAQGAGNYQAGA